MGSIRNIPSQKVVVVVTCSSQFAADALVTAAEKTCSLGELARSVLLVMPRAIIDAEPDPGEPESTDRESITITHGKYVGRKTARKPRIQLRMTERLPSEVLRKALSIAMRLHRGTIVPKLLPLEEDSSAADEEHVEIAKIGDELSELRTTINHLQDSLLRSSFVLLDHPCASLADMRHILGFHPNHEVSLEACQVRFRTLATVFHPDSLTGDSDRMAQLSDAIQFARGYFRDLALLRQKF